MKRRVGYLFWILMLAFGLMVLIAAAQVLAKRNIGGLKTGNRDAAITFTINNRLQDLINLSFDLESKITSQVTPLLYRQSLLDSFTVLGYNSSVFKEINLNEETNRRFDSLHIFTGRQIALSTEALQKLKEKDATGSKKIIDSLRVLRLTDSVYRVALTIEKFLEKDLQATLGNNTDVSARLSEYNKILAITAIAAVLILGTIIINRHLRQVQLIADLEKAKNEAQQSAQVKENFLANMSHEIRTPLNAIKGFSKILSHSTLNKEQQQYANIINDASNNLLYIVNDILDISKIEAGKFRIEHKEFNLLTVLHTLENMFSNTAAEKKLQYLQQIAEDVPVYIKGDPERLLQILMNLVSNAIKFTKEGFVKTTVTKLKDNQQKVWIEFTVEDTGPGIPANKREAIFQRFEQLSVTNDDLTKGTGLGLSITKSLAEMKGGSISVSGEPGKGSRFNVVIPFDKGNAPENISDESEPESDNMLMYENASALVVDDNNINQLLIKHTLSQAGINIDAAFNGAEALEKLSSKKYDIIFLDIQMPVLNGYQTIFEIRNRLKIITPVIAMTAFAMPGEMDKCLQAGMDDYVAKPVDFSTLSDTLKKYLAGKSKIFEKKPVDEAVQTDFLLQLAGGDKEIARKIIVEIKSQLPDIKTKLQVIAKNKDVEGLSRFLHHLVSTFSPLGTKTPIMMAITALNESIQNGNKEINQTGIDELSSAISIIDNNLSIRIEKLK